MTGDALTNGIYEDLIVLNIKLRPLRMYNYMMRVILGGADVFTVRTKKHITRVIP